MPASVVAARLTAQQLSGPPAHSAEAVVERLLAVQAQDPRGARLAVRSRSSGVLAADVDDALTTRRSLIVSWLNRGTLHLVSPDDYWWLHPLTTPQLMTGNRRRLEQEGVDERDTERGVDVIVDAVQTSGPQTRTELRERLDTAEVPTAGQALVHLFVAATLRGHIVRGPMRGADQAFVAVSDWLGAAPDPLEREVVLARLARRYLAGHGPADSADLAKWAGITLGDARLGLNGITDEVTVRSDGLIDLADRTAPGANPKPRLLGPFDPLLLGWTSREMFVGAHQGIVTTNGLFRACALVKGKAVATWKLDRRALTINPLEPVPAATLTALRRDGERVLQFLEIPDVEIGVNS